MSMASLFFLPLLYCFAFCLLLRPVVSVDALFNEPGQYLLAPRSLGDFGFYLGTNCSVQYWPKRAKKYYYLHSGFPGARGCQLWLNYNGTSQLLPAGEVEPRKFKPEATRSGYYVLAGVQGDTYVYGPAIFCTPKELCLPALPHAVAPRSDGHRLLDDRDSGLGGAVMSGPKVVLPGDVLSYANYTLRLDSTCNLSIVDAGNGEATWTTNTALPKLPVVECQMFLSPMGEMVLRAHHPDGRVQRLYGTGAIAGHYDDPGHLYALRYDGRLMIYPPKPWGARLDLDLKPVAVA
ncbi:hypothetical protein OPV22_026902 [Ensete ventricosum]|uniref:Uncharacterized protein n=1 Tax=Ensete ventricosum TaxID=4639 RepID=A0AAV8PYF4_ENSVE|nr:hypothetical protein OPV22_026902 [Ensete ventricosum]